MDTVSGNCNSEIEWSHPGRNGDPLMSSIRESYGRCSTIANNGRYSCCKLLRICVRWNLYLFQCIEQLLQVLWTGIVQLEDGNHSQYFRERLWNILYWARYWRTAFFPCEFSGDQFGWQQVVWVGKLFLT